MKTDLSPILNSLHNLIGDHNIKNQTSDYVHDATQYVPIYLQAEVPPEDPIYDLDIKIDGEHTFEQRPTQCGFSHYLHGESYDVLLDPLNINYKIGFNPGDNIEQVLVDYLKLLGLEGRVNPEELAKHLIREKTDNEDFRRIVNSKESVRRKRQTIISQIPPLPKAPSSKPSNPDRRKAAPTTAAAPKATKTAVTKVPSAPSAKAEPTSSVSITKSGSEIPVEVPAPAPVVEQAKPVSSKSVDLKNISNEKAMEEWKRRNEENLRRQKEQKEREEKEKKEREIQHMLQNIDNISIQKRLQATNTFIVRVQLYGSRSVVGIQCHPGDTYALLRERLESVSTIRDYHLIITSGTSHEFVDDDDFISPLVTLIQIPTNTSSIL